MRNFEDILSCAKCGDEDSIADLIEMYKPLLVNNSMVRGKFDEDLFQELLIEMLRCIRRFPV